MPGVCRPHDEPVIRAVWHTVAGLYVAYNHACPYTLVLSKAVQTADSFNRNAYFLCNRSQCFAILYLVIYAFSCICSALDSSIFALLLIVAYLAIYLIARVASAVNLAAFNCCELRIVLLTVFQKNV